MTYAVSANAVNEQQPRSREALLRRVLSPSPVFTLHGQECEERDDVERFVMERFQTSYNAEIHEFLPKLLSMRCLNNFSGVIGMRNAAGSQLFLEQYLNAPVEDVASQELGQEVTRRDIVEIGNLVAGRKGPSQFVFLIATSILHEAGYKWITFTATRTLSNNLNKLGFPMVKLADADPARLPAHEIRDWGQYYETNPQVMVGSLDAAMTIARKRPLFRKVMALYRCEIKRLANEFRGS